MDRRTPFPDILATEVSIESLTSTARSVALAAQEVGYDVKAARGLGRRIPKLAGQQASRQALTIVIGVRGGFGFKARHTDADGWDVRLRRPGWPDMDSSVAGLRLLLKAQSMTARADELATRRDALLKSAQGVVPVFAHG